MHAKRAQVCPVCGRHGSWQAHGQYEQSVIDYESGRVVYGRIKIRRVRCKSYGHTHAIIPDYIIPYSTWNGFLQITVFPFYSCLSASIIFKILSRNVSVPLWLKNNSATMVCPFLCVVMIPSGFQGGVGVLFFSVNRSLLSLGVKKGFPVIGKSLLAVCRRSCNLSVCAFLRRSPYRKASPTNSNVSGFSLSIPLFTAIKRTLFRLKISIAFPT